MKKGKGLNNEEYEVLKSYNEHVKAFNKAIKSNYREKASFALSLKQLGVSGGIGPEGFAVTVFTMGIGHRTNYKWLAPRYLKRENVAFVLITAPELWWWKHITGWGLKVSALVAVLAGIGWWLLG
ncbi:hypothetical protein HOG48_05875 [Candidatus Peregrinibacteria bacterium]|nr:hypothetical protein [Candidatus Peregrinibacteria bacterium]